MYIRKCFSCGGEIYFINFARICNLPSYRKKIGLDLLNEIWVNPIFVLNCCKCHNIKIIRENLEKRINSRPYKCTECGHGIMEAGLCYVCFFKKKEGKQ